jgi:hypothetical protein
MSIITLTNFGSLASTGSQSPNLQRSESGKKTQIFKLLDKTYPRLKADRMLKDLSLIIALTYSKAAVQQRLTFKPNPKEENSAPVVFQHEPDGDLNQFVLNLRSLSPISLPRSLSPIKELDDDKLETPKLLKSRRQTRKLLGNKSAL